MSTDFDPQALPRAVRRDAAALADTEDHAAALAAFTAKREPAFKQR